jgi:hypothetical protein
MPERMTARLLRRATFILIAVGAAAARRNKPVIAGIFRQIAVALLRLQPLNPLMGGSPMPTIRKPLWQLDDGKLEERRQRAQRSGERFGAFIGNTIKGVLMGLGIIFALMLIFHSF